MRLKTVSTKISTTGHIDAGKSTLNGNLLYLAGLVSKQKMHKFNKESKAIGKGSFALAWVMDGNKEVWGSR